MSVRAIVVFISVVVLSLLAAIGGVVYLVMQAPPPPPPRMVVAPVRIEPSSFDLGEISQCDEPITLKARLVNDGDQPLHLNQVIALCGCTVPELKTPLRLEPGGTHDFIVTLDPWSATGARTQRVEFIYVEAGRAPPLSISYDNNSPLRTHPGGAHRQPDSDLILRITADDGQPFLIESVVPDVSEPWILTPSPETNLTVDWTRVDDAARDHPEHFEFDADGKWKRGVLTIGTSRKDCAFVRVRLYNGTVANLNPTSTPSGPSPR